jgi:hypothetical protein
MSPETPGHSQDPPAKPVVSDDQVISTELAASGPLTPDDIVGLTDAERQDEAIQNACDEFCQRFQDFDDPKVVREAIKKADPEITKDELLQDMDRLEAAAREHLPPSLGAKSVSTEGQDEVPSDGNESAETETARTERLNAYVTEHFPDCAEEHKGKATEECQLHEYMSREFLEASYRLSEADLPDLKPKVEKYLAVTENETEMADNDEAIAQAEAGVATAEATVEPQDAEKAQIAEAIAIGSAQTDDLNAKAQERTEKLAEVDADLSTVKQLQARFDELRAEKGTIGALQTLLGPDGVKTSEMKAIVNRVLATATALTQALPGKSEVVTRILDSSSIDLGAKSPVQVFAGFLADADKSNELTDDEKAQIRQVLHKQADIKSGSDIAKVLKDGRGLKTTTDKDGNIITETIKYDRENPAEIQPGQHLFEENGKSVLRLAVDSGKVLEFNLPEGSEADMGKVAIIVQTIDALADMNLEGPIYQRGLTLEAGGRIDLNFPKDWVTTQRVLKIFFDHDAGWDNRLLTKHDTEQMKFLLQGIRYAFGVKTAIATINSKAKGGQFVVGAQSLPGNPYDGHTLGTRLATRSTKLSR